MEEELKKLFGNDRGKEIFEICQKEKISDMTTFTKLSTDNMKLLGLKLGEIINIPVVNLNANTTEDDKVKELLVKIKERHRCGTNEFKQTKKKNANEDKEIKIRTNKLHVGWLHSNDGITYVQKRLCDGGGTRELIVYLDEVTFDSLKERMIAIFLGHIDAKLYTINIGNFKREIIENFVDLQNKECSLKAYMADHGLYASKFRLYLMTTSINNAELKPDTDVPDVPIPMAKDSTFTVDVDDKSKTPNLCIKHLSCNRSIELTFVKYVQSENDPEIILRQVCFSREDCHNLTSSILFHEKKLQEYDPFMDNYQIRSITVGDVLLLSEECNEDGSLKYITKPTETEDTENPIIIYHPKDVCGFFETDLIVGVIPVENHNTAHYTWYRDNAIHAAGVGLICIWVYEPGTYHVSVNVSDDKWEISQSVAISEKRIVARESLVDSKSLLPGDSSVHAESVGASSGIQTISENDLVFSETDLIGKGSFSSVYRGKWMGTDVAIKRFSLKRQGKAILSAVERESLILCRLRHPNIVQIMGTVTNKNCIMLISELVDGENLETILFEHDCCIKLFENSKNYIGKQIVQAVAYLHNILPPIIHRDIKTANILVAKNSLNTKICDLGLSKIKVTQTAIFTNNIHVPGTIMYMAPELLLMTAGSNVANEASDMWSVGCVLLELFTNRETWETNDIELDLVDFIKSEMKRNRVPMGIQNMDSKCCWSNVINRCFEYNVIKRITAREIIDIIN